MQKILARKKRGQLDPGITAWLVVVVIILIMGPVMLKVVRGVLVPTTQQFTNSSQNSMQMGGAKMTQILGVYTTFWDGILLFAFLGATVLLFVSAFLIDAHPIFMVFYVVILLMVVLFAPNILEAVNHIYDSNQFAEEVTYLESMDFIRNNFGLIITLIGILSLLIIYAKMRYFSG